MIEVVPVVLVTKQNEVDLADSLGRERRASDFSQRRRSGRILATARIERRVSDKSNSVCLEDGGRPANVSRCQFHASSDARAAA
jgi:hypothetical protein